MPSRLVIVDYGRRVRFERTDKLPVSHSIGAALETFRFKDARHIRKRNEESRSGDSFREIFLGELKLPARRAPIPLHQAGKRRESAGGVEFLLGTAGKSYRLAVGHVRKREKQKEQSHPESPPFLKHRLHQDDVLKVKGCFRDPNENRRRFR
jgi:hypothetical protein